MLRRNRRADWQRTAYGTDSEPKGKLTERLGDDGWQTLTPMVPKSFREAVNA